MSSVDDLVISLTIKEGGNISKLQKQLTALVGTSGKGMGVGFMYLKKGQEFMRRDLKYVKTKIAWLLPTEIPGKGQPKGQILTAQNMERFLSRQRREYARKLMPESSKHFKILAEELGIKPEEEGAEEKVLDELVEYIKGLEITLQDIQKGTFGGDPSLFFTEISRLVATKPLEKGQRLTLYRNIQSRLKENEVFFEKILKKYGLTTIAQVWGAEVRLSKFESFFSGSFDAQGKIRTTIKRLMDSLGIMDEENRKIFTKKFTEMSAQNVGTTIALKNLSEEFDIPLEDLWKRIKSGEAEKSELLRMIAGWMLPFISRKETPSRAVPLWMQGILMEAIAGMKGIEELRGGKKDWFEREKIDLLWTGIENVEKAIELLGKEIMDRFGENGVMWIELENILSENLTKHIRGYARKFGEETLVVFGQMVKKSFPVALPKILHREINLALEGVKTGLITPLTEEGRKKIAESAGEGLEVEKVTNAVLGYLKQQAVFFGEEITPEWKKLLEPGLTYEDAVTLLKDFKGELKPGEKVIKGMLEKLIALILTRVESPIEELTKRPGTNPHY